MKPTRKSLTNKLDKIFREIILLRDKKCQRCQKTDQLQCAHIYSRTYRVIRWEPDNALTLCAGCHFFAHKNPVEFALWFMGLFADRHDNIVVKRREIFKTSIINLTAKLKELEAIKKNYEEQA